MNRQERPAAPSNTREDEIAAVLSPEVICGAEPLEKAPKTATPTAPPACRAALSMAEAVPERLC
jgi:hypothetical protein